MSFALCDNFDERTVLERSMISFLFFYLFHLFTVGSEQLTICAMVRVINPVRERSIFEARLCCVVVGLVCWASNHVSAFSIYLVLHLPETQWHRLKVEDS